MNNMNKNELFKLINEISFMLDDIALYLNTHPECPYALKEYHKYMELRKDAICSYTELYGPICRYDVNTRNYWNWVNKPWPWEGACNN